MHQTYNNKSYYESNVLPLLLYILLSIWVTFAKNCKRPQNPKLVRSWTEGCPKGRIFTGSVTRRFSKLTNIYRSLISQYIQTRYFSYIQAISLFIPISLHACASIGVGGYRYCTTVLSLRAELERAHFALVLILPLNADSGNLSPFPVCL